MTRLMLLVAMLALAGMAPAQTAAEISEQVDDDRGFLTRLIEENLSSAGRVVRVTGFQGALSSRASVAEISIADDDGVWLVLRDVELVWSRSALLARRLEVNRLSAAEIDLRRPPLPEPGLPSPEAGGGFSLPELPVSVRIGEIAAGRVTLGAPLFVLAMRMRLFLRMSSS